MVSGVSGVGAVGGRGGSAWAIRPGDVVVIARGGEQSLARRAAADHTMVHLAMQEADDSGSPVTWGRHVTDAEYGG